MALVALGGHVVGVLLGRAGEAGVPGQGLLGLGAGDLVGGFLDVDAVVGEVGLDGGVDMFGDPLGALRWGWCERG